MIVRSIKFSDNSSLAKALGMNNNRGEDGIEIRLDEIPRELPDINIISNYPGLKILTLKKTALSILETNPDIIRGYDLIDVDYNYFKAHIKEIHIPPNKLLISIHTGSKNLIRKMLNDQRIYNKNLKLVLKKGTLKDYYELRSEISNRKATFFMVGEKYKITRFYSIRGEGINYSYEGKRTAPGQFSMEEALKIRDYDVYGLVGNPLGKSLSKVIYEKIFSRYKINAIYLNFEINHEDFDYFIKIARDVNIAGLNFTVPFKLNASRIFYDGIHPINFVNFKGKVEAGNTDLEAIKYLTEGKNPEKVLIYGNGASAITSLMAFPQSKVYVIGRNPDKVKEFSDKFKVEIAKEPGKFDFLINSTPVGMYQPDGIPEIILNSEFETIIDFPYSEHKTVFQKFAEKKGLEFISGKEILATQASFNIHYWFGIHVSPSEILKILRGGKNGNN